MHDNMKHRAIASLSSDEWISGVHKFCSNDPVGVDPKTFVGWLQPLALYGLPAFDAACTIPKIDRAQRHVRLDGLEDYSVILQRTGNAAIEHNGRLSELAVGDVILTDPTRPTTVFRSPGVVEQVALHVPRQQLVAHLGFEPKGGLHRRGTVANRLLSVLLAEALEGANSSHGLPEAQMQWVVYDLLAALFTPSGNVRGTSYTDKLFARICRMIEARFADCELTPATVAAEARISARYLQKLFSARGTSCSHFIYALRLDHAARLLQRRAVLKTEMPLSEIAFACGFVDYAHFSRKFRARFGHPPSIHPVAAMRE